MTLDGYVAGPNQSVENPLGEGGDHLHDWLFKLRTFRAIHGDMSGGETGTNDDVLRETFENIGATIMGRNMFGGGEGPWGKHPWNGWWGDNPPFHHPVSSSPTTCVNRCPCKEARHSFSWPTGSSRR